MLPQPCYVYIMCTEESECKIGVSANPYRRLQDIQVYCPKVLQLVHVIKASSAFKLESYLHTYFAEQGQHLHSEWFWLTPQDLGNIARKWPDIGKACRDPLRTLAPRNQQSTHSPWPDRRLRKETINDLPGQELSGPHVLVPKVDQKFKLEVEERHAQRCREGYANLWGDL